MIEERRFGAGQVIFSQGDPADGVYIVKSGALEAFHTREGEELVYFLIRPGEMFGEGAVITNEKRLVSVRASGDTVVDFVPRERFLRSFGGEDNIALPLLKLLCDRLRHANDLLSGRTPLKRRSQSKVKAAPVRLSAGNLMVRRHIGQRPIGISRFPFLLGSAGETKGKVEPHGVFFGAAAADVVAPAHAAIELRPDGAYVQHMATAPGVETHVNGEKLPSEDGRIQATLVSGLNVVVLGNENSLWRLLVEVRIEDPAPDP
jgi:CRP-like cAMP-binding protein